MREDTEAAAVALPGASGLGPLSNGKNLATRGIMLEAMVVVEFASTHNMLVKLKSLFNGLENSATVL